jgi:hypothetical protein
MGFFISDNGSFTNNIIDRSAPLGHHLRRFAQKTCLRGYSPLSMEALTPEILRGGEVEKRSFDPRVAAPFVNKSVSEETRRAYRRALSEFFTFAGMKHPTEVAPADVLLLRSALRPLARNCMYSPLRSMLSQTLCPRRARPYKRVVRVNARPINGAEPQMLYSTDAPPEPRPLVVVALCGARLTMPSHSTIKSIF